MPYLIIAGMIIWVYLGWVKFDENRINSEKMNQSF
jgi:hypothetical protein